DGDGAGNCKTARRSDEHVIEVAGRRPEGKLAADLGVGGPLHARAAAAETRRDIPGNVDGAGGRESVGAGSGADSDAPGGDGGGRGLARRRQAAAGPVVDRKIAGDRGGAVAGEGVFVEPGGFLDRARAQRVGPGSRGDEHGFTPGTAV